MYNVKINRKKCTGCGACTKPSKLFYIDSSGLVAMEGGIIEDNIVDALVDNVYEVKTSAAICPMEIIRIYNDDTDEEVKIEYRGFIDMHGKKVPKCNYDPNKDK